MKKIIVSFAVAALTLGLALPAVAAPLAMSAPHLKVKDGTSSNWSGYAAATSLTRPQVDSVSNVKGSWVVPALDCSDGTTAYSSAWVGIDGYNSGTVEQLGTEHDCVGGVARYSVWYEMYPKWPFDIAMVIHAGDLITAEVSYIGKNQFSLKIANNTTGASFETIQRSASAKRVSAEWVMEAPWSSSVLPLANFGTAFFSESSAKINGHTGPINDAAWKYDAITMVTPSGAPKDIVSALSNGGKDFSLTWQAH